jgi:alpha-1,2-mannosyltransferase
LWRVPTLMQSGSADQAGSADQPRGTHPARQKVLVAGVALFAITALCYGAFVLTHPANNWLDPVDLHVYVRGGNSVLHHRSLYNWSGTTMQFTYPPFAALVFAVVGGLPWHLVVALWTLASMAALAATVWVTLGALGYSDMRVRSGGTLAFTAVLFWTAPVLHVVYLGQIELLLMALVMWDLCQPEQRRWQGIGVGIAAGIKLVPLIFIPYLLLTRRYRQAVVATVTFALTVVAGFALPADSRTWWLDGLFTQGTRTGFPGRDINQSLPGLITRLSGSVAAGRPVWLVVSVLTLIVGVTCAALLHRLGHPVIGILTCAITGLLASPVSWDHHWVWIVPVVVVLAIYGLRASGAARYAMLGGAILITGLFLAWPGAVWGQPRYVGDFFEGLVWWPPGTTNATFLRLGDRSGYAEYHWHGFQLVVGNLYVLTGMAVLVVAAAFVLRSMAIRRREAATDEVGQISTAPVVSS